MQAPAEDRPPVSDIGSAALAARLLAHADAGTPWPAALRSALPAGLDGAYALALAVAALREARGERPAGFKIGFTNRTIWPRYGVWAPVWGRVWGGTLSSAAAGERLSLAATCEPRLEPEVVFGFAATPPAGASLDELFDCLAWFAPGFEVVQSHCPGWRFSAAETVADGGLHARLHVGTPVPLRDVAGGAHALDALFSTAEVTLARDGTPVDRGRGAQVLDGPLHALQHFVQALAACPGAPALRPGDVVTTGTWTDAWPVAPGQRWQMAFSAPWPGLAVVFD